MKPFQKILQKSIRKIRFISLNQLSKLFCVCQFSLLYNLWFWKLFIDNSLNLSEIAYSIATPPNLLQGLTWASKTSIKRKESYKCMRVGCTAEKKGLTIWRPQVTWWLRCETSWVLRLATVWDIRRGGQASQQSAKEGL